MGTRTSGGGGRGERGGVALVVALSMFLIMGIALSSLVIGRLVFKRRELQSAADAMVLAAAHTVEQYGLPFSPVLANPYLKRNSDLTILASAYNPVSYRFAYSPQYRRLVRLDLTARYDTWQKWLPQKLLTFKVSSWAQFNEQWFGDPWPILYFIFDASKSMESPIAGGSGDSAWKVLKDTFFAYASLTLPSRNGVIVYGKTILSDAPPPTVSSNNLVAIKTALNKVVKHDPDTNIADPLDRATQRLSKIAYTGKNVVFLTDGGANTASGCPNNRTPAALKCATNKAMIAGTKVRMKAPANLYSIQYRNAMVGGGKSDGEWKFLVKIAGRKGSTGNDKNMARLISSKLGIEQFLNLMVTSLCAWGPLKLPSAAYSIRDPMSDPSKNPRRLFAFLWDPIAGEMALPMVTNIDTVPKSHAFQHCSPPNCPPGNWVILSRHSCQYIGANAKRRLIVRWDQPQLSKPLTP